MCFLGGPIQSRAFGPHRSCFFGRFGGSGLKVRIPASGRNVWSMMVVVTIRVPFLGPFYNTAPII